MKRLVLDIETVPISNQEMTAEESKKAALDALTGRIVCLGYIFVDYCEAQYAGAFVAQDDKELLRFFWDLLHKENIKAFVGHNGLSFDLPYIWKRSVIHQIKPTIELDLRRYRTDFIYDTMCVWGNWENRGNASLDALATGLGIGGKSGHGSHVLELWRQGKQREIASYCLDDCWLTYECYCKMNFTPATGRSMVEESLSVDLGVRGRDLWGMKSDG
jgi:predicted PolB exonuclease-like 3'-5' exonuclease